MARRLEELTNKEVIARGYLEQMPETVNAAVPKKGMYLRDFKGSSILTIAAQKERVA
jgi:hypothetical protein